jgi:response regulator RpfG family c-di-GMP phosphodiesterase
MPMIQNLHPDRILIVDDEDQARSLLIRTLEAEGSKCVASPSAQDALSQLGHQRFSLVISDFMMPGMSGIDLLRRVKQRDPETAFIMITGLLDIHTAVDSLRTGACDFITKPFELMVLKRAVHRALERRRLRIVNQLYREELEQKIRLRTFELRDALRDVQESYKVTLEALVAVLDAREHETNAHSQRVREYTLTLSRRLGLKHDDLIETGRGALLHDVGKIGVRDSILLKPGRLNEEEWIEMRKHPQIGYNILRSIDFLAPAAKIVLCHQERWDGRGYPNSLTGHEIPLGARIFAIVDAMDAMTSDRPYRKALSFETAIKEIYSCAGTQFDPEITEVFLRIPVDSWNAIRALVSRSARIPDCSDLLCPTSIVCR